jgi:hypothetical protein
MKQKPFANQLACFTGEFVGGTIAGIGLGIIMTNAFLATSERHVVVPPLLWICAFFCTTGGSLLARSARLKRLSKHDRDEKPDA